MGLTLFPYQVRGVEFLSNRRRALLADDMGVGKTPQAIVASEIIGANRIVVICPAILCKTWAAEIHRWRLVHKLQTTVIQTQKDIVPQRGAVILSYDLAVRPSIKDQLTSSWRDLLILDESHFLKDKDAGRTRAVYGDNLDGKGGIAGRAHRVWCLSGTPTPNHPGELYAMLRFFGAWKDGFGRFLTDFTIHQTDRWDKVKVTGVKNPDALRQLLKPVMLRRLKKDVLKHLPPLTVSEVVIDPEECDEAQQFLAQLRAEEPAAADKIKRAIDTDDWTFEGDEQIARIRRLVGLAKVAGTCKLLLHEIEHGLDKIVVFGMHKQVLEYSQDRLFGCGLIYGATPDHERQALIEGFQTKPGDRVLLAQIKTAGTGLTLTASSNVMIAEASWTPADNAQAMMRVHRIGQVHPVLARFVTLAGTIDEAVTAVLRRKSAQIAAYLA